MHDFPVYFPEDARVLQSCSKLYRRRARREVYLQRDAKMEDTASRSITLLASSLGCKQNKIAKEDGISSGQLDHRQHVVSSCFTCACNGNLRSRKKAQQVRELFTIGEECVSARVGFESF